MLQSSSSEIATAHLDADNALAGAIGELEKLMVNADTLGQDVETITDMITTKQDAPRGKGRPAKTAKDVREQLRQLEASIEGLSRGEKAATMKTIRRLRRRLGLPSPSAARLVEA
jgi:hypothetical protein